MFWILPALNPPKNENGFFLIKSIMMPYSLVQRYYWPKNCTIWVTEGVLGNIYLMGFLSRFQVGCHEGCAGSASVKWDSFEDIKIYCPKITIKLNEYYYHYHILTSFSPNQVPVSNDVYVLMCFICLCVSPYKFV